MIGRLDPAVAVGLTVFHALVSTVLPVLLVGVMFPDIADRPWLSRAGLPTCVILLAVTTATGFATPAHRGLRVSVLGCVLIAVVVALVLPGRVPRPAAARPTPSLGVLRLAGSTATVAFYAGFAIVPGLIAAAVPAADRRQWQILPVILMEALFCAVVAVARSWTGRETWGPPQTLAVITGVLLPTIVASLILPAALMTLEPLVTVPVLVLLNWLRRRQGRVPAGERAGPPHAAGS